MDQGRGGWFWTQQPWGQLPSLADNQENSSADGGTCSGCPAWRRVLQAHLILPQVTVSWRSPRRQGHAVHVLYHSEALVLKPRPVSQGSAKLSHAGDCFPQSRGRAVPPLLILS
ncbi:hypothetical protein Cadr_000017251 [Camelus dromedarius]|uniref:Uncharacterized protein n=1 Tax=Camelus dromedarius TaxID=9838 RepID=A0A5N4DFJ2_CAMDR|nr:hypothetical protein Cadr_000017251 [Camelus dromedarius]